MNLFGMEIKVASKEKDSMVGKCYIEREDCHEAMSKLERRLDDFKAHLDVRFDDMKDFLIKRK